MSCYFFGLTFLNLGILKEYLEKIQMTWNDFCNFGTLKKYLENP